MMDVRWDYAELDRALLEYAMETQKDLHDVCNQKAFQLAGGYGQSHPGALQLTAHADAGKIARNLALVVQGVLKVTRSKSGRVSVREGLKRSFGEGDAVKRSVAARIVNARLVKRGERPIWGAKLADAARKLTSARIRSVNFIRAGWIGAIRDFASVVNRGEPGSSLAKGQPKGYGIPARIEWTPSAAVINTALNPRTGGNGRMVAVADEGLQKAVIVLTADIEEYLTNKLQGTANRHNTR